MKTRKLFMGLFLFMTAFVVGLGGMKAQDTGKDITYYLGNTSNNADGTFIRSRDIETHSHSAADVYETVETEVGKIDDYRTKFAVQNELNGIKTLYSFAGWKVYVGSSSRTPLSELQSPTTVLPTDRNLKAVAQWEKVKSVVKVDGNAVNEANKSFEFKVGDDVFGTFTLVNYLVAKNGNIEVVLNPALGYAVDTVKYTKEGETEVTVNGTDTDYVNPTENPGEFKFVLPVGTDAKDYDVTVTFKKVEYDILEGAKQAYKGKGNLVFRFEGSVEEVSKVFVGKTDVTALATLEDGSVYVTLPEDYVSALKPNTYSLKVVYNNGNTAETTFVVPAEENPKTGDNIALYITIGLISMVGLAGAGLYLKKRRFN